MRPRIIHWRRIADATGKPRGLSKLKLLALLSLAPLVGCSTTSLQCGVDGDSSYVNINTSAELIPQLGKNIAELCSFAEVKENGIST